MGVFAVIPFSRVAATALWAIGDVNAGILFVFALTLDRRLRHLARRLGLGLEVPAARQRARRPRR